MSVLPGILGRFTRSASDTSERARLFPTLRGGALVKGTELVVCWESKQRSGCLSGWEGAGDSILSPDAELCCLGDQIHGVICPWIPVFCKLVL